MSSCGIAPGATILDSACGIGTQSLGLAELGYQVRGSDISGEAVARAKREAAERGHSIDYAVADFCNLSAVFADRFDAVLAMDNALPHLLEPLLLEQAATSIHDRLADNGVFIASIRVYDAILREKPRSPAPYVLDIPGGRRVAFQTWDWQEDVYRFTQYIIEDTKTLGVHKFSSVYRAVTRAELTSVFTGAGFRDISWLMPGDSGYYQPIAVARR